MYKTWHAQYMFFSNCSVCNKQMINSSNEIKACPANNLCNKWLVPQISYTINDLCNKWLVQQMTCTTNDNMTNAIMTNDVQQAALFPRTAVLDRLGAQQRAVRLQVLWQQHHKENLLCPEANGHPCRPSIETSPRWVLLSVHLFYHFISLANHPSKVPLKF